MKNKGISILGVIAFLAIITIISWGLNYIITKDYVVLRAPIAETQKDAGTATNITTNPATKIATSTVTKTVTTIATSTQNITPKTVDQNSDITITFDDKGFSPASVTIKKNQTITFINNSSKKMWVASNPFPSSSDYPAFNQKASVTNGSSWDFTFDKTGVWFYHNHFSPAQGGRIIVNAK